jgi:glycosyltransferase involved in cell wall biosynthesis
MIILHVINIPLFSATAYYALNTALAQKQAGCEVFIAGELNSLVLERANLLGLNNLFLLRVCTPNIFFKILSLFKLKKLIEKNSIDVVNVYAENGLCFLEKGAKWAVRTPLFVRTIGNASTSLSQLRYGVIVTSRFIKDKLRNTTGFKEKLCKLIPPSVDTEFFKRNSALNETSTSANASDPFPVFGLVGSLDKNKGHFLVMKALKILVAKGYNVRCVIAGPEKEVKYEELKNFARDEKLTQRIFFLGKVSDIRDVYRICDCGIIASTGSESGCHVALEFMAMRIPVIASRVNGMPDVIPDDAGCAFFESGDVDSLAEQMENFLSCHANWHGWKTSVRSYVTANHSLSKLATESLSYYKSFDKV